MGTEVQEKVVGGIPPKPPRVEAISPTSTCCRKCVFAEWEESPMCLSAMQINQTGCRLDRLEKFREKDPSCVVEAYDELTPEDGGPGEANFFVINGRICRGFRSARWARSEDEPIDEQVKRVRQEMSLRLALIVPLLNSRGDPVQRKTELAHFCASVMSMNKVCLPRQVIFVNKQKYMDPRSLHTFLCEQMRHQGGEGGEVPLWKVVQVLEDTSEYEQMGARLEGKLVDIGVEKLDRHITHYAVFFPRHRVPPDFALDLDRAINDGLERFSLLTPDRKGAGMVVQRNLHEHPSIGGNALIAVATPDDDSPSATESILWRLEDKVRKMAEGDEEGLSLIRPVTALCRGMAN